MTNYKTIPTSTGSNPEYLSRAKETLRSHLGNRRPWREIFDFRSLNFPSPIGHAIGRIRTNLYYFRMNYAIIMLFILFLSLLWHPISLIVFVAMMAAWLFLYFLRDEPLTVFHRRIDDRVVIVVLGVLTIGLLLLTGVTLNVLVSVLVGVLLVLLHAVFRNTENLFLDEEAAQSRGLLATTPSS